MCGHTAISEPAIKMDLTAGFDSRAVLAVLLSAVGPERVKAFTVGGKEFAGCQNGGKAGAHIRVQSWLRAAGNG